MEDVQGLVIVEDNVGYDFKIFVPSEKEQFVSYIKKDEEVRRTRIIQHEWYSKPVAFETVLNRADVITDSLRRDREGCDNRYYYP